MFSRVGRGGLSWSWDLSPDIDFTAAATKYYFFITFLLLFLTVKADPALLPW